MDETPRTRLQIWTDRLRRLGRGLRKTLPFVIGALAAFAALLVYNRLFPAPHQLTPQEMNTAVAQALGSATPPPPYSEQAYAAVQPSLVLIQTKLSNPVVDGPTSGLGSGVVIDQAGDILTSLHVVTETASIKVTFADGTTSSAQITTQQPEIDIAVIKADHPPAQIVPATLGNPSALRVGDEAYVVGNPFGLYSSMSAGVISGFNRDFEPPGTGHKLTGLIQIDTAVNPGNSGGPLINRYGQVVGIVEGIVNPTGQDVFIGIGFAVPINVAGGVLGSPID